MVRRKLERVPMSRALPCSCADTRVVYARERHRTGYRRRDSMIQHCGTRSRGSRAIFAP